MTPLQQRLWRETTRRLWSKSVLMDLCVLYAIVAFELGVGLVIYGVTGAQTARPVLSGMGLLVSVIAMLVPISAHMDQAAGQQDS